jgi:D-alanine-D-alanine ligase
MRTAQGFGMHREGIGLIHNVPGPAGGPFSEASRDVLRQVEAIEEALKDLGHSSIRVPFTRDVSGFIQDMEEAGVEMAVNLCEGVDDNPQFAGHPAAMLELLTIPFSGSPSIALMLTTDKVMTKRLLSGKGIKTPHGMIYDGKGGFDFRGLRYPVIVKPVLQDASIGIDQESIFQDAGALEGGIGEFFIRFGTLLVEEYVHGREFNVSLFGYPSPRVLPVAEIDFSALSQELFPIVGYRAKWDCSSYEYHHTPRKFLRGLSPALQQRIERTALGCFHLLMLRDYGRVDMRVDEDGQIYVLEVNANPCLSPDAGFGAAVQQAGMTYTDMVRQFVDFIERRSRSNGGQAFHV